MWRTRFRVNSYYIVAWISRKSLLKAGAWSEGEVTATGHQPRTAYFLNEHSNIWPNWPGDWAIFLLLTCMVHLTVCSFHITYAFQSESPLYSCLNVKEILPRSRTQNNLVLKRTLNHLAKLVKWLSCVLSTYLYGAFYCMFLSCHVRVSEWIHTLYLPEHQGTPCPEEVRNLKVKGLQLDWNPQSLSSWTST